MLTRLNNFWVGLHGTNHDGSPRSDVLQFLSDFYAAEQRHLQIEDNNIGPILADIFESRLAIFCRSHDGEFRCQHTNQLA